MCLEAAGNLQARGIEAGVVNLRFINPLDRDTLIKQATISKKIVTVEDHILAGGMGSAILELLELENINDVTVQRIGYNDFVEHGPIPLLHKAYGLSVDNIVKTAEKLVNEK